MCESCMIRSIIISVHRISWRANEQAIECA